jgi:hypothetical protein
MARHYSMTLLNDSENIVPLHVNNDSRFPNKTFLWTTIMQCKLLKIWYLHGALPCID